MNWDELNLGILKALRDGRRPFREVAAELGVSENTVRARVQRLQEAGMLEICGLVDPATLPGHRLAMMGIKLSGMNLVRKAEELSRLPGVVSALVVTGRYDILLTVLLRGDTDLLEFFTERLDHVAGVLSVETFVAYKGFHSRVPYVVDEEGTSE